MAKTVVKSSLAQRLGEKAAEAAEAAKSKPIEMGGGGLPAGIEGGIARLVECSFKTIAAGKANAGKDMFFAAGIVVSPEEHNGVIIRGLRTNISEFLFDTPTRSRKTVAEHVEWVQNEFKKFRVDEEMLSLESFEDVAKMLTESKPYFRFRTWSGSKTIIEPAGDGKSFKVGTNVYASEAAAKAANPFAGREPSVQSEWLGACDYAEDEGAAGAVDDSTVAELEAAPEPPKPVGKPVAVKPDKGTRKPTPAPEPEPEGDDLDALAAAADDQDTAAQLKLTGLAKSLGINENEVANADSWTAVAQMIGVQQGVSGNAPAKTEASAEEAPFVPEVGNVFFYVPPKAEKQVECEVKAVNEEKRTVNLQNLDDNKVPAYRGVSWDALLGAD